MPLNFGADRIALSKKAKELESLLTLLDLLEESSTEHQWIELPPNFFRRPAAATLHALPLRAPQHLCGFVILKQRNTAVGAGAAGRAWIVNHAPLLATALHAAVRAESWRRIERLQKLAHEHFQQREPEKARWNLDSLVKDLAELFLADAVTIFLAEEADLFLAASTDPKLGSETQAIYPSGEGLTGWVFKADRPLRLKNTADPEEVYRRTGLKREGSRFPEHDAQGEVTGQFLGVPMHFGERPVGVLRMFRRRDGWWFSKSEEEALQFFANLLGWGVARSRRLQIANSVLDSVTEGIAISRREWHINDLAGPRIVMANKGAVKILGRPEKELRGLAASTIYAPGEYEGVREGLRQAVDQAKREGRGEYGPIQCRLQRPDGAQVPVMISYRILANPLLKNPTLYTVGVARDVSESERLAERHRRFLELLETMGIAYFEADQNGMTVESTPTDSAITGYSHEDWKTVSRTKLYADDKERERLLAIARRSQGRVTHVLLEFRRENGERVWAEGDIRILADSEGREVGLEGFYRDVTDRMRLQAFLNEDSKRLLPDHELLLRLEDEAKFHLDYLSSIGHQIQTPLSSLVETLQNFEKGIVAQTELLSRLPWLIGQARVCSRLLRNLSYMDKILRGEPFEMGRVSLAKLAIETKLDFSHLLKAERLKLAIDDKSLDRHLQVWGQKELLRQVLVNLVDNAIKYSAKGSEIRIRGHQWPEGRVLEISNEGFSIPKEDRERIFQRGFRTRRARSMIPHGTGLGLWLVSKIVEAHEARIVCDEVMEKDEKRVVFRITFPHEKRPRGKRRPA